MTTLNFGFKWTYLFVISALYSMISFTISESILGGRNPLIGIPPEKASQYHSHNSNGFRCIDGSAIIPFQSVNDDYCDCRDASDEPGTSACPHGRFYCPNDGYFPQSLPSSYVNDGICDCCDGSDEYNSTRRCENSCAYLGEINRQELERRREVEGLGASIRSQYKQEAKQKRDQNTQLLDQYKRELSEKESAIKALEEELNADFGPSHVFLPLKGKCFTFQDREYTYSFCPFDKVVQESSGQHTELGRWSGWSGPSNDLYSRQSYQGGIQCWNGPARSAIINIACGIKDDIVAVSEPAKCEYIYDFMTPAACPDTDPPATTNAEGSNEGDSQPPTSEGGALETEFDSSDHDFTDEPSEGQSQVESPPGEIHDEL